eukprot:363566-Chlamydomonas_euryale.AAC.7
MGGTHTSGGARVHGWHTCILGVHWILNACQRPPLDGLDHVDLQLDDCDGCRRLQLDSLESCNPRPPFPVGWPGKLQPRLPSHLDHHPWDTTPSMGKMPAHAA